MDFFEKQLMEKEKKEGLRLFRVWEIHKEHYKLRELDGDKILAAVLKGSAFYKDSGFQKYPAIGDIVAALENGAMLIDTPGMRQLGLWSTGEGTEASFEDVLSLAEQCRFSDCRHETEPGCAVCAAIADGTLAAERLCSFKKLQREAKNSAARAGYLKKKTTAYKNMCKNQHQGKVRS